MAALPREKSQESLRLQAVSQLNQMREGECSEVPIAIDRRTKANLWGQLPVEAMVQLRSLPDKTVRVFAALVSLLQGSERQVQVAEVAFLSALKDRQTREHLKKLEHVGLIGCRRSLRGPNWYWQELDCAGPQYPQSGNADSPTQSGNSELPTKDYINQKRSLTPPAPQNEPAPKPTQTREGRGGKFSNSKKLPETLETVQDASDKDLASTYLEERQTHQKAQKAFESACREVSEELCAKQLANDQKQAIEQAIKTKKIPLWWAEMIDQVPISGRSQTILMEAVPRKQTKTSIELGLDRFLAERAKMRQEDLDAAFSLLTGKFIHLAISGNKQPSEISIADIHRSVEEPTPNQDEVRRIALDRLGWQSEPEFKSMQSIERYGKDAERVIELANKAGEGNTIEILEKWVEYPVEAVIRLVEFEKEKAETDHPVRNHRRWWKSTLCGILEKQKEQDLRKICS